MFIFALLLNLSPAFAITAKPGAPPNLYRCPDSHYTTSRYAHGADRVWCIEMRQTRQIYKRNLFQELDFECRQKGGMLTGFQNKTEFMEAYNMGMKKDSYYKYRKSIIIIGVKRKNGCTSVTRPYCTKINGYKWNDVFTNGTRFFEEMEFGYRQPNPDHGRRMCIGVGSEDFSAAMNRINVVRRCCLCVEWQEDAIYNLYLNSLHFSV